MAWKSRSVQISQHAKTFTSNVLDCSVLQLMMPLIKLHEMIMFGVAFMTQRFWKAIFALFSANCEQTRIANFPFFCTLLHFHPIIHKFIRLHILLTFVFIEQIWMNGFRHLFSRSQKAHQSVWTREPFGILIKTGVGTKAPKSRDFNIVNDVSALRCPSEGEERFGVINVHINIRTCWLLNRN